MPLRAHLASLMLSAQGQGTEEKLRFESALSHGFSDLKSFNTVFRARFSKTPTEYRRQLNETVTNTTRVSSGIFCRARTRR